MILRPSSAYRWTRCAAAPTFEDRVPPQPESDEAREGTCAAWVIHLALTNNLDAIHMLDETHPNGWVVTIDMVNHVQKFIDMIRARGGIVRSEQEIILTPNIRGTLDVSASFDHGSLAVDDYKHGMRLHEVFEHYQLLIYAGGELLRLNRSDIHTVVLGIYQPRAFHPDGIYRRWTLTVAELWRYIEWIVARGNLCLSPEPIATPGPHCRDCRAITSCAAVAATNYANVSVIEDRRQRHMTPQEAVAEWQFLEMAHLLIKSRRDALDAEINERFKREHFPGLYLKPRKGHRQFKVDASTVKLLTGVDPTNPAMITPAELERRGVNPDMVDALSHSPNLSPKLAKMPENAIEQAFKKRTDTQ